MLDKFHDIIGGIHVPVDDGVDKLNRKYTLLVFLFLALPIFTKQYIGDPIECFAPVYFAEHQSRYINSYCWTQSTYYMVPVGDPDDDGDQQEPPDRIMPDEVDYFIGFETVTHIGNERLRRVRVSYYQWAPLILLAQGLCFYIPFLIWNSCANNAGVKLRRLLKKASDIASLPPGCQQREALLAEFVDQFHTLVTGEAGWCADLQCGGGSASGAASGGSNLATAGGSSGNSSTSGSSAASGQVANGQTGGRGRATDSDHHHRSGSNPRGQQRGQAASQRGGGGADAQNQDPDLGPSPGCCLVSIPILGSLISCCLKPFSWFSVGQFLGRGYLRHGLELINRLVISGEWWSSPRFPLSTLCQVRADMSGGLRSYTCQCVLPINVFNEKIFSVVWFYMAFLLPLNVLSLLFWIYRTFESNRMSYIRLCLWRTRLVELNQIHRTVRRLSQSYLGWDGVFLLRLIEHNHGSIMATLIMSRLWEFYANQIKLQEDANQMALANNAQHTLSNTTTAISNQYHQFLTNQPHSHQSAGGAGAHTQQQHQQQAHGGSHHSGGAHQQQMMPSGGHHHGPSSAHHHHGPGGHHAPNVVHGPPHQHGPHFAGPHPPLQPTQAFVPPGGGHPGPHPPPPPMVPHGSTTGHHSGQISQAPGHHPLHAANTAAAAAHHVHHAAAAALAAAASGNAGPHLSGAFTGPSASLLAQLQHAAAANQTNSNSTTTSNQQQANNQQQQGPGNVAAAVASLAAAAAATTNSQPSSGQVGSTATATTTSGCGSATSSIHLQALKQQQQTGPSNVSGTSNPANNQQQQPSMSGPVGQQHQTGGTASSATTSFIQLASGGGQTTAGTGSGPPLPPPPPAHVVAAVAAATGVVANTSQQARSGVGGPATTSAATTARPSPTVTSHQQPAPPPHTNLFNLKSSSTQATGGQGGSPQVAGPPPNQQQQNRFSSPGMKR